MDEDQMNDRLLKIFFPKYQEIHKIIGTRIQAWEEEAYGWLDGVLEEASQAFGKSDNALLPKTPSAKRKPKKRKSSISRRRIQLEEEEDDYVQPAEKKNSRPGKGSNKRTAKAQEQSDEESEADVGTRKASSLNIDQEFQQQEAPVGRRTRAASRAATTSKARTKRTNKTKKKTKSGQSEPVLVLMAFNQDNVDTTQDRVPPLPETANTVSSCVTPSTHSRKPSMKRSADLDNDVIILHGSPQTNTPKRQKSFKTPIQNFNSMNVKEKVMAYEEIVLISPLSSANVAQVTQNTNNNNTPQNTIQSYSPVTPRTPATVTRKSVSPKTPEQIDSPNVPIETRLSRKLSLTRTVESPVTVTHESPGRKSSAQKRRSSRPSLRVSLKRVSLKHSKRLPSMEAHNMSKPSKPRTRLRLKKKQKEPETESVSSEAADTTTSSAAHDDLEMEDAEVANTSECVGEVVSKTTSSMADDDENNADVSDMEADDPEQVKPKATRRKTRAMMNTSDQQGAVKSSTRTKTRQTTRTELQQTATATDSAQSADENMADDNNVELCSNKDSGLGSRDGMLSGSSTETSAPRVTRSKMRKPHVPTPPSMDTDDSDGVIASPRANPPRATRTKTRKRQHEEASDGEPRQPKRSCTETSILSGRDNTPTNTNDEQSSDDCISTCPPGKVVRPKIFTHTYPSSVNKPPNLNPSGIRSFIHRNSPAPKPTLKEIQEKKKKELLEKEKKNEERIRRQKEEHQRQMDEIRKKRALKMKRVEEIREQQKKKQQEQQHELEKRLAEKRQLTNKIKEDRLKEEKAKHKIRLQKAEEVEERRKQEEEERKRKLNEQLEAERAHAELLQRKKEQEELERQRKIEEEKKLALQKKKEERERALAQEKAERDRQEKAERERREQERAERERLANNREEVRLMGYKQSPMVAVSQWICKQSSAKLAEQKREEEVKRLIDKHNQSVAQNATGNTATKTLSSNQSDAENRTEAPSKTLPKPNLNTTQTLVDTSYKKNSYEMTPPNPMHNYGIDDLNSGDETDDDEAPRKKIPEWAQGQAFKALLVKQLYNPPDLNKIFPPIQPPDLNEMFVRKRARWNNRTSSAHWTSPIMKTWDHIRK